LRELTRDIRHVVGQQSTVLLPEPGAQVAERFDRQSLQPLSVLIVHVRQVGRRATSVACGDRAWGKLHRAKDRARSVASAKWRINSG